MTGNERLGQAVVKAAVCSSKKALWEEVGRAECLGFGGAEGGGMLCISVFMSFGLCVLGGDNYDPNPNPVSPRVAFHRISWYRRPVFQPQLSPALWACVVRVRTFKSLCMLIYVRFLSSTFTFPPFRHKLKISELQKLIDRDRILWFHCLVSWH